jgi:hypothetical protein
MGRESFINEAILPEGLSNIKKTGIYFGLGALKINCFAPLKRFWLITPSQPTLLTANR